MNKKNRLTQLIKLIIKHLLNIFKNKCECIMKSYTYYQTKIVVICIAVLFYLLKHWTTNMFELNTKWKAKFGLPNFYSFIFICL